MKNIAFLLVSAGLALGAVAPVAAAEPRQVITHEKLWMMKRVWAPKVSPDGKWVVYALVEPSYEKDGQVSDLWIVPADGSAAPRRLTSSKAGESGAAGPAGPLGAVCNTGARGASVIRPVGATGRAGPPACKASLAVQARRAPRWLVPPVRSAEPASPARKALPGLSVRRAVPRWAGWWGKPGVSVNPDRRVRIDPPARGVESVPRTEG